MPTYKVTTTLFAKQEKFKSDPDGVRAMLKEQRANVLKMKEELSKAAKDAGNLEPINFEVSMTLVPDWSVEENGYQNQSYIEDKNQFIDIAKEVFGDVAEVKDFYTEGKLTNDEKDYLHQLKALGSIADMMKNRAIINNQEDCHHLQIDSNTKIQNYPDFYNKTMGSELQKDRLNASYYDPNYVSVHNKVVYTAPKDSGKLARKLEENYLKYCKVHKDDLDDKAPQKNSMYAKVFAPSMADVGYARKAEIKNPFGDVVRVFYPADMALPEFLMTGNVVTAINMSWAPGGLEQIQGLKSIPPNQIDNVAIDFPAFTYVVKKHTGDLDLHTINLNDAREQLLNISDTDFDNKLVTGYYDYVKKSHPEHLVALVESIQPTLLGDSFVQKNFHLDRDHLLENAQNEYLAYVDMKHHHQNQMKDILSELRNKLNPIINENPVELVNNEESHLEFE